MEHSKLLWATKKATEDGITLLIKGDMVVARVFTEQVNAADIATACNEHDTLKAKADLFDELVDELESSTGKMRFITGFDQERKRRIEALLAKCKEINNVPTH